MTFERRTTSYEGLIGALVERRLSLGLTQMQLDAKVGWADGTSNKYEHPHRKWGKHLGRHSLPLFLAALGLELVVVEKGRHVQRIVPARQFGPGDPEWLDLVRAHETGEGAEGSVGTADGPEVDTGGQGWTFAPVQPGCMTRAEAADMLAVSKKTIKRWIGCGHLAAFVLPDGKVTSLVRRDSVEALLQAGRKWSDGGARVESPPLVPAGEEGM